jgi:hypothetical protein
MAVFPASRPYRQVFFALRITVPEFPQHFPQPSCHKNSL